MNFFKFSYLKFFLIFPFIIFSLFVFWAKSSNSFKTYEVLNLKQYEEKKMHENNITLATYNIGYASGLKNNLAVELTKSEVDKNLNHIINDLKKTNADIIGFQEIDLKASRTFNINQLTAIAHALKIPYVAYVVTWNKKYVPFPYFPLKVQFGSVVSATAVLSRYPIKNQKIYFLDQPKDFWFFYNWFYLNRAIQKIIVNVNQQEFNFFHVHLEAFDKKERSNQVNKLANLITKNNKKTVFAFGDFNMNLEDEDYHFFTKKTGLKNSDSKTLTYPSLKPYEKIDHIFYSDKVSLVKTDSLTNLASDHILIYSTFRF